MKALQSSMSWFCLFQYVDVSYILECYRREISFIGSTSFGFAQNTINDFQNTVLNSYWHCLRQTPQKKSSLKNGSRLIMSVSRLQPRRSYKTKFAFTRALQTISNRVIFVRNCCQKFRKKWNISSLLHKSMQKVVKSSVVGKVTGRFIAVKVLHGYWWVSMQNACQPVSPVPHNPEYKRF